MPSGTAASRSSSSSARRGPCRRSRAPTASTPRSNGRRRRVVYSAMPELNCRLQAVQDCPDVAVVTIQGSIDPRNLSSLEGLLSAASGRGYRTAILDLAEVRYINSAGLSYLVNLAD